MQTVALAAGVVLLLGAAQDDSADIQLLCVERTVDLNCPVPSTTFELDDNAFDWPVAGAEASESVRLVLAHERDVEGGGADGDRLRCALHEVRHRFVFDGWRQEAYPDGRFTALVVPCVSTLGGLEALPEEGRPTALELVEVRNRVQDALRDVRRMAADGSLRRAAPETLLALVAPPLPFDAGGADASQGLGVHFQPTGFASTVEWPELEVDGALRDGPSGPERGEESVRLRGRLIARVERFEAPAQVFLFFGMAPGERSTRWTATLDFDASLTLEGEAVSWESSADVRLELDVTETADGGSRPRLQTRSRATWTGPLESRISSE